MLDPKQINSAKNAIKKALASVKLQEVYLVGEDEGDYSSYRAIIEGSNKRLIGKGEKDGLALRKIVNFIKSLSQAEKDNFSLSWHWDEDFGDGDGDVVVSVYGPSEMYEGAARTMSNWRYAENVILVALGLKR